MSELPYTYTDPGGDSVTIIDAPRRIIFTCVDDRGDTHRVGVSTPTGDDAIALAEAVLAAADLDRRYAVVPRSKLKDLTDQSDRLADILGSPSGMEELRLLVQNQQTALSTHRHAHRLHSQFQDRRIDELEALTSEQANVIERQSRDIETLGAAMRSAEAAIRGLAKTSGPATYSAGEDG